MGYLFLLSFFLISAILFSVFPINVLSLKRNNTYVTLIYIKEGFTLNKRLLFVGFSLMLLTACNNNAAEDTNNRTTGTSDVGFTSDQSTRYTTNRTQRVNNTDMNPLVRLGRGDHQYHMDSDYREGREIGRMDVGTGPSPTDDNRYVKKGRGEDRGFGAAGMNGSTGKGNSKAQAHNGDILKIKNGVITIDPNAYSTSTPSSKYPHSKFIKQGQWKFVSQPGQQQPTQQQQPRATQPQQAPTQNQNQPAPAAPAPAPKTTPAAGSISTIESRVIELTNAERRKAGLPALQADTQLSNVAREKSRDMQTKGYFSHTSPTYGSPFDMMRDFGITYQSAGENIAKGQRTPEEVVQAWMNSEGHRKNILSGNYSHIGVGYVESGNHWTQMFIKK
jgi:uncharacterized YkwD family protein